MPVNIDRAQAGEFLRMRVALFLAGFATFSLIYAAQPLLPRFAADFGVTPAVSSWALSLTTVCLAFAIVAGGIVSEAFGRRGLMFVSLSAAALLHMACALPSHWAAFLSLRALEGVALGGVPAVAMAYLSEETPAERLGAAMGLYIGGTALGGMLGRVVVGIITQATSWRVAMGGLGLLDLFLALAFYLLLPPSRAFKRRTGLDSRYHWQSFLTHLRHGGLVRLFLIGSLAMGAFVTMYNYAGFRLQEAPYLLDQRQVGLIFLAYLAGTLAATLGGALTGRVGLKGALIFGTLLELAGVGLTTVSSLTLIIVAIVIVTVGFFTIQSVASAGVGKLALHDRGHAASLYLVAYYIGASVLGSAGGWFWRVYGWPGVAGYAGGLLLVGAAFLGSGQSLKESRR